MFGIYNWFYMNSLSIPDNLALIVDEERLTYKELSVNINHLAYGLHQLGVKQGDRVGILFYNGLHFVETFYAAQKLGAFLIPFNYRLNEIELQEMMEVTACQYFFFSSNFRRQVNYLKQNQSHAVTWICAGGAEKNEHSYEVLSNNMADEWDYFANLAPDDEVLAIFTGGTTGRSKAAVHTQQGLVLQVLPRLMNYNRDDSFLNFSPLFHFAGLTIMITMLCVGGRLVLAKSFDPEHIMGIITKEKITHMVLMPPNLCSCIKACPNRDKYDLSSVRLVRLGGNASSQEIIYEVSEVFPHAEISNAYTNSEYATYITMKYTKEQIEQKTHLINALGKPVLFSQVKLLDEDGNDVRPGEAGEVWGKSFGMMSRYLEDETIMKDGWLSTGDIMKQDQEGYYYFLGRKKDMIKSGGENVYALEVEQVINTHPEVAACAVVGLPNKLLGEMVVGVVVKKEGSSVDEEDIIQFCKSKIASYKKPKRVFFVNDLPVTAIGKVQKNMLKKMIITEYGTE